MINQNVLFAVKHFTSHNFYIHSAILWKQKMNTFNLIKNINEKKMIIIYFNHLIIYFNANQSIFNFWKVSEQLK